MAIERRWVCALIMGAALTFSGCKGQEEHSTTIGTPLASAREVIDRHRQGTGEAALLEFVNDSSHTFDLTESDIADMVEAGVSTKVVDAALARSDEHHRSRGHDDGGGTGGDSGDGGGSGDGHSHSH